MKKVFPRVCTITTIFFLSFLGSCTNDPDTSDKVDEPIILRSHLRNSPDFLNPFLTTKAYSLQVVDILFPSLTNFAPNTNELSPMLAKSRASMAPITEGPYKGGAAYTYEIHEAAVWDNGQPVLASDYAFTLKAMFNPEVNSQVYRSILGLLKGIKIDPDNPKRFTIYTDRVFRSESSSGLYVYPEHAYDSTGLLRKYALTDFTDPEKLKSIEKDQDLKLFADRFNSYGTPGTLIESCGAYRIAEWEPGQRLVLEKKKNWWGDKLSDQYPLLAAYPDEIIYKTIPDMVAAISALKDGQLDVIGTIPTSLFLELKESAAAEALNFHTPEKLAFMYICLNSKRPHLADKKVRRALAHLTDVNEIIESIQSGMAVPSAGPFPPNASYNNKAIKPIPFDIEKAKILLKEAGWKDSDNDGIVDKVIKGKKTPLQVTILVAASSETSKNIVTIIKEDARKAGVAIEIEALPYRDMIGSRVPARNFDGFASASGFDLDLYPVGQSWHTSSDTPEGHNRAGFGNSQTDAIIDEIRSTNDDSRRKDLYFQIQDSIYDAQPYIFLYTPLDRIVISKKFKEAKTNTLRSPGYLDNHFH